MRVRRLGSFLVRAAWERRPEGRRAVLCLLSADKTETFKVGIHLGTFFAPGSGPIEPRKKISRVVAWPIFSSRTIFCGPRASIPPPRPKKFKSFWVWLVVRSRDRAAVLLPPLQCCSEGRSKETTRYERDYNYNRAALPSGPQSSRCRRAQRRKPCGVWGISP